MGELDLSAWERFDAKIWRIATSSLKDTQRLRVSLQIIFILGGGTLAGLAQFLADSTDIAVKSTWHWLGGLGVTFVAIGTISLLLIEKNFNLLIVESKQAIDSLREYQVNLAKFRTIIDDRDRQIRSEEDRNIAFDMVIQILDQALSSSGNLEKSLQDFVGTAGPRIIDPLILLSSQDFTLSIFLKKTVSGEEKMVRVANYWKEQSKIKKDRRNWPKGIGWTGEAWRKAADNHVVPWVIEQDAATDDAKAKYNTVGLEQEGDYERFRSVIAVPFRRKGAVAGVVTVTTGRVGTFSHEISSLAGRNAAMVKTFTKIVSALVASGEVSIAPATKST